MLVKSVRLFSGHPLLFFAFFIGFGFLGLVIWLIDRDQKAATVASLASFVGGLFGLAGYWVSHSFFLGLAVFIVIVLLIDVSYRKFINKPKRPAIR